jgi:hypothetical protein
MDAEFEQWWEASRGVKPDPQSRNVRRDRAAWRAGFRAGEVSYRRFLLDILAANLKPMTRIEQARDLVALLARQIEPALPSPTEGKDSKP